MKVVEVLVTPRNTFGLFWPAKRIIPGKSFTAPHHRYRLLMLPITSISEQGRGSYSTPDIVELSTFSLNVFLAKGLASQHLYFQSGSLVPALGYHAQVTGQDGWDKGVGDFLVVVAVAFEDLGRFQGREEEQKKQHHNCSNES